MHGVQTMHTTGFKVASRRLDVTPTFEMAKSHVLTNPVDKVFVLDPDPKDRRKARVSCRAHAAAPPPPSGRIQM